MPPLDVSHLIVTIIAAVCGAILMRRRNPAPIRRPRPRTDDIVGAERVLTIIFSTAWLVIWTVGVVIVAGSLLSAPNIGPALFVLAWLTAAVTAWTMVAYSIVQAIRGKRTFMSRRYH